MEGVTVSSNRSTRIPGREERSIARDLKHREPEVSIETRTLIERVRALPPEDRIALVEDVLDSLDHPDPAIDRLWAREAADRVAACRRGEVAAKELSTVVAKYRP
jgi:putative addiction module component (TIGR02574 family)